MMEFGVAGKPYLVDTPTHSVANFVPSHFDALWIQFCFGHTNQMETEILKHTQLFYAIRAVT